jgi:hypothetical protein
MEPLLERVAFSVGGVDYRWSDAVLAGALWGEWSAVVERARSALAAMELEADAESPRVGDDEIEAAADEFRYARHLVSAEDAERWLARWELDADRWVNWIWADLLRRRLAAEDPAALAAATVAADDEELAEAIRTEAICSGELQRFAERLAARVAIGAKLAEGEAVEEDGQESEAAARAIDPGSFDPGFAVERSAERLRAIARLDRAFDRFCSRLATPEAVAARVRSRQADWMRVSCRILAAATEDVAREALAAIQEDGAEMSDVAAEAQATVEEGTYYLEALDPGLRDGLLAAQAGELLGPLRTARGWAVVRVLGKSLPSPEDEAIRRRAEASLVDAAVAREVDGRVTWQLGG